MKTLTKILTTESDMNVLSAKLAQRIHNGFIIFLYGPLGAGKTTFTRGFLRGIGFSDKVKSPTYTLVEPYEIANQHIFHFDLYRLDNAEELTHMGIQDYFSATSICLIEWPEKGFPLLPQPDLACYIDFMDDKREIKIEALSKRGEDVLEKM